MKISIENLTFAWAGEPIMDGVSGQLQTGDLVMLCGENGSGKTTLLKLLCGMIPHFTRGRELSGNILINGESILMNPPKHFFPSIAFIPNQNLDFFMLNRNLQEEILVLQTMLKKSTQYVENKISRFNQMLSDFHSDLALPFSSMSPHQKMLSLTLIYFIQDAKLYLFDETLIQTMDKFYEKEWYSFLSSIASNGGIVLYVSHNRDSLNNKIWELKDRKIIF
ncbi:ATP-binding cassette domain-containing protein [candidate division KSB1 bacterium]|nr:ATP-binding cassette domain-containing protein [candidate division KSB1 bacterium]